MQHAAGRRRETTGNANQVGKRAAFGRLQSTLLSGYPVGFRGGETIPEASSDFPQGSPFDFRRMPMLTAVDTTSAI